MPDHVPPLDAIEMLKRLAEGRVDFVVIGGVALSLHGSDRNTNDLDICFGRGSENLERLGRVLVELKAHLRGADPGHPFVPDARTLRGVAVLTLSTRFGWLDVLASPQGAPRYSSLVAKAQRAEVAGDEILFASIDHLISMKQASGRPRDVADIEELKAIRRLQRGDPPKDSFGRTAADVLRELGQQAPD